MDYLSLVNGLFEGLGVAWMTAPPEWVSYEERFGEIPQGLASPSPGPAQDNSKNPAMDF